MLSRGGLQGEGGGGSYVAVLIHAVKNIFAGRGVRRRRQMPREIGMALRDESEVMVLGNGQGPDEARGRLLSIEWGNAVYSQHFIEKNIKTGLLATGNKSLPLWEQ